MRAYGVLLLYAALCTLSASADQTPRHALKHEDFALYATDDGHKIMEFGSYANHRHKRDIQTTCRSDNSECTHHHPDGSRLTVRDASTECKVVMHQGLANETQRDEIQMGSFHWFGGPEQKQQYWPLEAMENNSYPVTPQEWQDRAINDGVWYNSDGTLIIADKTAPLFYEQNTPQGKIYLVGKLEPPYEPRPSLQYTYYVCKLSNAKEAFQYAIKNFLNKPSGYPNEDMIRYPIWSTWVRYKRDINETLVREFAKEIKDNGFKASHMEVDDRWETCYGSTEFDKTRFPNMKNLTDDLRNDGFHVTLWTHFFIQLDCTDTLKEATDNGYLVQNVENNATSTWWNGVAAVVDFTNENATKWWVSRHQKMMEENGIDGMKFDAGESSFTPQLPKFHIPASPTENYPGQFTEDYVRACAQFGNRTEFRTGHQTQELPIFVRMIDKDSRWGFENGLKTLVTTLLQMNSVGYPMVLPDMIGGNAYDGDVTSKELFIRWLQANTFMPALQYSLVPWTYDDETIQIARHYADLHDNYTDTIVKAMKKSVEDGTPVNPPIWWLDPQNEDALKEDSEFLVGEDILVAPVLEEGATTRAIVFPQGNWKDPYTQMIYQGPTKIESYDAPLNKLPYFLRTMENPTTEATTHRPTARTARTARTAQPTSPTTQRPSNASSLWSTAATSMLLIWALFMHIA